MPAAIPAAIAIGASTAAAAAGTATFTVAGVAVSWAGVATVAGTLLSTVASMAISMAQDQGAPLGPAPTASRRQGTPVLADIYGRARVGGDAIIWHEVVEDGQTGFDLWSFHFYFVLAAHPIDAVEEVWAGDTLLWSEAEGPNTDAFPGFFNVDVRLGHEVEDPPEYVFDLDDKRIANQLGGRAADFRHAGRPVVFIRFFDVTDEWREAGVPQAFHFVVRGKRVHDPRTDTTAWTDNWALCCADYLKTRGGLGPEHVRDAEVAPAATICDEDAGGERTYAVNGTFPTDVPPRDTLTEWSRLAGTPRAIVNLGDRVGLYPAAERASVVDILTSDWADPVEQSTEVYVEDVVDAVGGTFIDPAQGWQPAEYERAVDPDYAGEAEDMRVLAYDFPREISKRRAKRLAWMRREQATRSLKLTGALRMDPKFLALVPGDMVRVIFPVGGIDARFEVIERKSVYDPKNPRISIVLLEEGPIAYVPPAPTPFPLVIPGLPGGAGAGGGGGGGAGGGGGGGAGGGGGSGGSGGDAPDPPPFVTGFGGFYRASRAVFIDAEAETAAAAPAVVRRMEGEIANNSVLTGEASLVGTDGTNGAGDPLDALVLDRAPALAAPEGHVGLDEQRHGYLSIAYALPAGSDARLMVAALSTAVDQQVVLQGGSVRFSGASVGLPIVPGRLHHVGVHRYPGGADVFLDDAALGRVALDDGPAPSSRITLGSGGALVPAFAAFSAPTTAGERAQIDAWVRYWAGWQATPPVTLTADGTTPVDLLATPAGDLLRVGGRFIVANTE